MAELALGWQAENVRNSAERMKQSAAAAESNVEFQYVQAILSGAEESKRLVAKANAMPFSPTVVKQTLLLIDRMDASKQIGEIKLAIAEDAISDSKDPRASEQFLLSKASAMVMIGKRDQAIAMFKQLLGNDSKNLSVLLGLARISTGDDALKLWRSIASRTKPQSSAWFEAKYNVAKLLHETGKNTEAAKMLKYIKAVPPGWEDSELKDEFERLLLESDR